MVDGCPWKESVCASAAEGGHLEVLKYCPWNEETYRRVVGEEQDEVANWTRQNGCPIDSDDEDD